MLTPNSLVDQKFYCPPTYKKEVHVHGLASIFPSFVFYMKLLLGPFRWLCWKAKKGECDDICWIKGSKWFSDQIEEIGCPIIVEGLDILDSIKEPCVICANHMSTLETFLLPAIVRPYMPVTFVVKESLTKMPFFGNVMRSRNPIVVNRKNPREDLTIILSEGTRVLQEGISIIIFPQSTRSANFDPKHFNSIAEKLAKKASVPLLPLALKTDAWSNGKHIKEIGSIHAGLPVHFRFTTPIRVDAKNSKSVHEDICRFIQSSLDEWKSDTI